MTDLQRGATDLRRGRLTFSGGDAIGATAVLGLGAQDVVDDALRSDDDVVAPLVVGAEGEGEGVGAAPEGGEGAVIGVVRTAPAVRALGRLGVKTTAVLRRLEQRDVDARSETVFTLDFSL